MTQQDDEADKMARRSGLEDARAVIELAWQQIEATDAARHPHRLTSESPAFVDYAWHDFAPPTVLGLLLSDESYYSALKPILFAGLCTWVVCPKLPRLRRLGMLLVGIEHLQRAEVLGRAAFAGRDLLGDIVGRVLSLGQDFYTDFYYPIGGLSAMLQSTTSRSFARSLAKRSQDVGTVVTLMQIFDHHAKHLSDRKIYYQASQGKGYELVRDIYRARGTKTGSSVEISKDRWQALSGTASLIYAASTIPDSAGRSLLDVICTGEATFEEHGRLLRTWVGRARYAAEIILGGMVDQSLRHAHAAQLPEYPRKPTPPPIFSESERAQIEAEFKIAVILGGRKKTEARSRKS